MTTKLPLPFNRAAKCWGGRADAGSSIVWSFIIALALRAAWMWLTEPTPLVSDELFYYANAAKVARDGDLVGGVGDCAPLIVWCYAVWFWAFGVGRSVQWFNVVVGALTVVPSFVLGHRLAGPRAGKLAAAGVAVYPTFVVFGAFLLSEPLYILLEITVLALLAGCDGRRLQTLVPAGALLGLAALTRPVGLFLLFFCALWVTWRYRAALTTAIAATALFLVSAAVVVAPWIAMKSVHNRSLVIITRTNWLNLYLAHCAAGPPYEEGNIRYQLLGSSDAERERAARAAIVATLRKDPLRHTIGHVYNQTRLLFAPDTIAVRRLMASPIADGDLAYSMRWDVLDAPGARRAIALTMVVAYIVVAVCGAVALPVAGPGAVRLALAAALCAHWLPAVLAFATTRFRLPIMPLLLASAAALVADRGSWGRATPTAKLAGALLGTVIAAIAYAGWVL